LASAASETVYTVTGYGLKGNDESSYDVEYTNSQAFMNAIYAANDWKKDHPDESVVVWIPEGSWYSMFPIKVENIDGLIIRIDAYIKASKRHTRYPTDYSYRGNGSWSERVWSFLTFNYCSNLKFEGKGTVDGQGFMWWLREYIQTNGPPGRPHLHEMYHSENIEFTGIKWMNSPQYHMFHQDINNFYYHDFEIYVDWWGQFILGQFFLARDDEITIGDFTLPTFPLNTDGIDPAGSNVLIERINITNFDDAVAVKPQGNDGIMAHCSENIVVRDCLVTFGVGMTIGSVPPSDNYHCVRNITFERVVFFHPFKAIYVKTNPGHTKSMLPGSGGEITNVLYKDITIHHPIWWSIYIGPQQQKQPGGAGPGCMFYPLGGCETQPLITVANITLQNVQQFGNLLPPGVVRCNETNPCYGFKFENVNADGWWRWFGQNYITENIHGVVEWSNPAPSFITDGVVQELPAGPSLSETLVKIIERFSVHFDGLASDIGDILKENAGPNPIESFFDLRSAFQYLYDAFTH